MYGHPTNIVPSRAGLPRLFLGGVRAVAALTLKVPRPCVPAALGGIHDSYVRARVERRGAFGLYQALPHSGTGPSDYAKIC